MKSVLIAFLILMMVSCASTKKLPLTLEVPVVVVLSSIDSLSYALGVQVADFYKNQGVDTLNSAMVKQAYDDVYGNKKLILSQEEANMTIQQKLQEYMDKKTNAVKEEGVKFLEANKSRAGVITTASGLQYEIIKEGTGPVPKSSDTVLAHYSGSLIDGKEFDNSFKRGKPLEIPVTGVIQGWIEALQLMPVGSKWKLFIPSELGYGDRGAGGAIPGGAALIFEIELLEIVNK